MSIVAQFELQITRDFVFITQRLFHYFYNCKAVENRICFNSEDGYWYMWHQKVVSSKNMYTTFDVSLPYKPEYVTRIYPDKIPGMKIWDRACCLDRLVRALEDMIIDFEKFQSLMSMLCSTNEVDFQIIKVYVDQLPKLQS